MKGLGDNIYQRIFVRAAASCRTVWLETPWPELYADLPGVRCVKAPTQLRTQAKNIARQPPPRWHRAPAGARPLRMGYGHASMTQTGIIGAMEALLPLAGAPFVMDLPNFGPSRSCFARKPIAIVRPVTVRSEWRNEARNPRPDYVAAIAAELMRDYHVVSIADLAPGQEWLVEPAPPAHERFHHGELAFPDLMALVQSAALIVGGVGWIVPAAIAAQVPAFIVLGGQGGHNAPDKITDRRMDLSRIGWAWPDRYCRCADMRHACDKRIHDPLAQFATWRQAQGL